MYGQDECGHVIQQNCSTSTAQPLCTPTGLFTARNSSKSGRLANGANVARVLFAEHFGSDADDWGDRINAAIQASFAGAPPATIELPAGTLNISGMNLPSILCSL